MLKSLEAKEVSEELCLDLSNMCGHHGFGSFWRLGAWRSCPGCVSRLCACVVELWKKTTVSSQAAISNLLHHWHASAGSRLWRSVDKYSHLDFFMVTKMLKDTKRRCYGLCPLCCLPFCFFFHRTELVRTNQQCQARIWGFCVAVIKERASRLSTFSNLKVWNQTQLRLVFKAQDMEAFNAV